jgi:hypothetical protein
MWREPSYSAVRMARALRSWVEYLEEGADRLVMVCSDEGAAAERRGRDRAVWTRCKEFSGMKAVAVQGTGASFPEEEEEPEVEGCAEALLVLREAGSTKHSRVEPEACRGCWDFP